jgi:cyclophilin family peptidyl-prolyl cis-trans isomerase
VQKPTDVPIKNEGANGLKNDAYTIAMARTNVPDSATSQFFINVKNNDQLNAVPPRPGYAVFGQVVEGKEVVDKIKGVPTGNHPSGHQNVPTTPVVIEKVECI